MFSESLVSHLKIKLDWNLVIAIAGIIATIAPGIFGFWDSINNKIDAIEHKVITHDHEEEFDDIKYLYRQLIRLEARFEQYRGTNETHKD